MKNLLRNLLIVANFCMISLCYYSWRYTLKSREQLAESPEIVNEGYFRYRKADQKGELRKNVLTQVKVFPRGGLRCSFKNENNELI